MRKKALTPFGETEMEVLQHVWTLKKATVAQVHDRILATRKVAYTTIMTVMKKLSDKGYLSYEKSGATYIYQAVKSKEEVQQTLLTNLLDKAFDGSSFALIQTLVKKEDLSEKERDELVKLIADLDDHGDL